jgi:hypothetical protein
MYQTAFTWDDGTLDGGSSILDYRLTHAIEEGDDIVLRQGISTKSFIAHGLITGTTYTFKV